jgi:hypothetical protein
MMDAKAWSTCPTIIANIALRAARRTGLGWAQSSALPAGEWREGEPRPSLAKISRAVPCGIDPQMDYFSLRSGNRWCDLSGFHYSENGWYELSGVHCSPHVEWTIIVRQGDRGVSRRVSIWTDSADSRIRGVVNETGNSDGYASGLGEMCRYRWEQAWELLGGRAPRFPTPGKATFVYGVDEWPDDLRVLDDASIEIPAGSSPSNEEYFAMLVWGETIIRYDEHGPMYVVAAYEEIEEAMT